MAKYNLDSPNSIHYEIDLENLSKWCEMECEYIKNTSIRSTVLSVVKNIEEFVQWPGRAILLWSGCDRVPEEGKKQKYHSYPKEIKTIAKEKKIYLDGRPNGPAIAAFHFGDGIRPDRFGSSNSWHIHHLYSGKFPYPGHEATLHSAKSGNHFTQSAGLVSIHPIADAICDEFPFFSWYLRCQAFKQFGYDPDSIFSKESINQFGFAGQVETIYVE